MDKSAGIFFFSGGSCSGEQNLTFHGLRLSCSSTGNPPPAAKVLTCYLLDM